MPREKKLSEWTKVKEGWYESRYGAVRQWWTSRHSPCGKVGWYAWMPGGDNTAQPLGIYKTKREAQKALMEVACGDIL